MIEIIGWIATIGTLISFTMNDMAKLRLVGGSFAILWIVYGFLKMDNPIIVINSAIVMIHLYWFHTNRKGLGVGGESLREIFIDSESYTILNKKIPNKKSSNERRSKCENYNVHGIGISKILIYKIKRLIKKMFV